MATQGTLPKSFWVVAWLAVIWNLVGVATYFMEVTTSDEAIAALPEAQQALYAARPAWVIGAFAIAVFAGLAGSILLALRKRLAVTVFALSLAAILAQMFYSLALSDMLAVMGAGAAMLPIVIIVIAAFLVWYSIRVRGKGWLG